MKTNVWGFVTSRSIAGIITLVLVVFAGGCKPGTGSLGVELIAEGFASPTFVTGIPGDSRLFVTEKSGVIWIVEDGQVLPTPYLDISNIVLDNANEQGLFSIAFHPMFAENGFYFVCYTGADGATVVARYTQSAANMNATDESSAKTILSVPQPAANHNGGQIAFGPDEYLYVGLGDGGGSDDVFGNAQDLSTLLGAILRIDIDTGDPYGIPPDNPFIDTEGAAPEIWAYGLRNPWRFSFDRDTGDLYIADLGQNTFEEVNFQPASSNGGENYGWPIAEGFECLDGGGTCGTQPGFTPPVLQYGQPAFQAVIGGYVYRGGMFPELNGSYFYADYISSRVWTFDAPDEIAPVTPVEQTASFIGLTRISSFGEGGDGELYVTDFGGGLRRIVFEPNADATKLPPLVTTLTLPFPRAPVR